MSVDLEAMMNAALGASQSDNEVASGQKDKEVKATQEVEEPTEVVEEEVEQPVEEVEEVEEKPVEKPKRKTRKRKEPDPEPVVEEEEYDEPDNDDDSDPVVADVASAEFIAKLLNMSDIYRAFDDETQVLALKLFDTTEESDALSKALIQDEITSDALQAISRVHEASEVDKAFFLVALPDELLKEIGRLVYLFTDTNIKFTNKIKYCRELELELRKMDDNFIKRTNSIYEFLQASAA